jgi:Tol biopolymer transport system component
MLLIITGSNAQQLDLSNFKGPYLGQRPPTDTTKIFLPEIFNNIHSTPVFSPDGKLVYWRSMDQKPLLYMVEVNGIWSLPKQVPFKSLFYKQDVPFFSNDGNRLFFMTTKPKHFYQLWSNEAIWYIEKKNDNWSKPKQLNGELNKIYTHWQFSVAANGNIYLNGSENGKWFIFKSELKNGKYAKPEKVVQPEILAQGEPHYLFPFIAPDETYLIFSKKVNGDDGDLFITFQNADGSWTNEINMGAKINSKGLEICPIVTSDGKYLFYIRRDRIMWASAKIIEELRFKN